MLRLKTTCYCYSLLNPITSPFLMILYLRPFSSAIVYSPITFLIKVCIYSNNLFLFPISLPSLPSHPVHICPFSSLASIILSHPVFSHYRTFSSNASTPPPPPPQPALVCPPALCPYPSIKTPISCLKTVSILH